MDKKYESVKIDSEVVSKVRNFVAKNRQSISGYFTLAAEEKISGGVWGKVKDDPELFYAYQANIAMAIKDEFARRKKKKKSISYADMHEIANTGAKNFLHSIIKDITSNINT